MFDLIKARDIAVALRLAADAAKDVLRFTEPEWRLESERPAYHYPACRTKYDYDGGKCPACLSLDKDLKEARDKRHDASKTDAKSGA